MTNPRVRRKIWRWSAGILSVLVILAAAMVLAVRILMARNGISYESLKFHFPSTLTVEGITVQSGNDIRVELDRLEVGWSWGSLLRLQPSVTRLHARDGILEVHSKKKEAKSHFTLPGLTVEDVRIRRIRAGILSENGSVDLRIGDVRLNRASTGDSVVVDSLFLDRNALSLTSRPDTRSSGEQEFSMESLPLFRINHLAVRDSRFSSSGGKSEQKVSGLDLVLNGWRSDDLLTMEVNRLGFTYQDTLDLQIVLGNGEVNDELQAGIKNLAVNLPGASLNLKSAEADLSGERVLRAWLAPSWVRLGTIRLLYAGIDAILHPSLPDSTRFFLEGNMGIRGKEGRIEALSLRTLDSTRFTVRGMAGWSGTPRLDLQVIPFRSARSDLTRLLAPASYHDFYNWPTGIGGEIRAEGTLEDLHIKAGLDSREGFLDIRAGIIRETEESLDFTLEIRGDSVSVSRITGILPLEIPRGQVRFLLGLTDTGTPEGKRLLVDIESNRLITMDRNIHYTHFLYDQDFRRDSMHVEIRDEGIDLVLDLLTPSEAGAATQIEGALHHFYPGYFVDSWPRGPLSSTLSGRYLIDSGSFQASVRLDSSKLGSGEEWIRFPSSTLSARGADKRIELEWLAAGRPVIRAETGTEFPAFDLPLPGWIEEWPDTKLALRTELPGGLVEALSGTSGSLRIDTLWLVKDAGGWSAGMKVPGAAYGAVDLDSLALEAGGDRDSFTAGFFAARVSHPEASVEGAQVALNYLDGIYALMIGNEQSVPAGRNRISLTLSERGTGYRVRLDEQAPPVIYGNPWEIRINQGIDFDSSLVIREGDLGIGREGSLVEVITGGDVLELNVDSLNLGPLVEWITGSEETSGQLSADATWDPNGKTGEWELEARVQNQRVPEPALIDLSGDRTENRIRGRVNFHHAEAEAAGDLVFESGRLAYDARLTRLNLAALHYLPGVPEDLELEGMISGRVSGLTGETPVIRGTVVAEEARIVPPLASAAIYVERDSIVLKEDRLSIDGFRFRDGSGNQMALTGTVTNLSDPELSFRIQSDAFSLLEPGSGETRVSGNLDVEMDLEMKGSLDNLEVTGELHTLPEGEIYYRNEKMFQMVDASHVVTFMDLDRPDSTALKGVDKPSLEIRWDVDLTLEQTFIEVLLDEVSQQFIRIYAGGDLRLRSGFEQEPLVFGSIRSEQGRAYIEPSPLPDLDLTIEQAEIRWDGLLEEPAIDFLGYKEIRGSPVGLAPRFNDRQDLVEFTLLVTLEEGSLDQFDLRFDLEADDTEVENLLSSLPRDTRQAYALNLLVFGRAGTQNVEGRNLVANQVTGKLNELARRNFKNTGIIFSSTNYAESTDTGEQRERTDLNYAVTRGFLDHRLNFSVGNSVGFYTDDATVVPPTDLIGDISVTYRLSENPTLVLKGSRESIYQGIIDGVVTQESLGISLRKSYPTFRDFIRFRQNGEDQE